MHSATFINIFQKHLKAGLFVFFLSVFFVSSAQSDSSLVLVSDSSAIEVDTNKRFSKWSKPEKVALMSAILPGLGQFHNKKYWKIPIIWAAEGALLTNVFYQHSQYKIARNCLIQNNWETNPRDTTFIGGQRVITEQNYRTARDNHRRNRDYYIILSSLVYGLNIVDAVVDAHLSEFNLSDDLSLQIKPTIRPISNTFATGVTLNFNLK